MGFAPNSSIIQNIADSFDTSKNLRVSWRLDETNGEWWLEIRFSGLSWRKY
jgi:hypothetical protein